MFLLFLLHGCIINIDGEINPNLIYGQWKMTSYTNSGDNVQVTKAYILFHKDNTMGISYESPEVIDEIYFFRIVGDKLYFSEESSKLDDEYLTIVKLTNTELVLRADLDYETWSECTFTKL
ncbi:MAG: lipocalin family protein [Paludibacteraceae bacterium]